MPDDNRDNPAKRLLKLLRAIKEAGHGTASLRFWSSKLGISEKDPTVVLARLGAVLELPSIVERAILLQFDIDHEIYLRWKPKVSSAFSVIRLDGTIADVAARIDEVSINGLEFCSALLDRQMPEPVVDRGKLRILYQDAAELCDEVSRSQINSHLKAYIMDKLYAVMDAFRLYDVCGSRKIREAVEATLGSLGLHPDLYQQVASESLGKRFWEVMTKAAVIVTLMGGIGRLSDQLCKLLPAASEVQVSLPDEERPLGTVPHAAANSRDNGNPDERH